MKQTKNTGMQVRRSMKEAASQMHGQNNHIVHCLKSMRYLLKQLKTYSLKMVLSVVCGFLKEVSMRVEAIKRELKRSESSKED